MIVSALPAHWRSRATELERYAPLVAQAFRDAADQLDAALQEKNAGSVTLKEAAEIGGYSLDHIQRLVRSGDIENVGRKGRPRVRPNDIPVKPGHAAKLRNGSAAGNLQASAIVASVLGKGGNP